MEPTTLRPKPVVLLILDGWGIGPKNAGNAIELANPVHMNSYPLRYPHGQLAASGEAVGLPKHEDGNTETGHLNIGAGRIVYQDLPRINMTVADGSFACNPAFLHAFEYVQRRNSVLHLMGLLGSGGVHSNVNHLYALLSAAKQFGLTQKVVVHVFMDGRDSPPTAGAEYIHELQAHMQQIGVGEIGSVMGRYYAMDRDLRWDRTEVAYNALTLGTGLCTPDLDAAIRSSYTGGRTDEFIEPINVCSTAQHPLLINDGDAVIFFNYRIDRPRQLTRAFVQPDFEKGATNFSFDPYAVKYTKTHLAQPAQSQTFPRQKVLKDLFFVTMTEYERDIPVEVAFPPHFVSMPIGRVISEQGLRQLHMSETEKERFVTYYFNGQREAPFPGEVRMIIPSQKVPTYDLAPEMSARQITDTLLQQISLNIYDAIFVNFANADMVGHTGNLAATIQACKILDECVGKIVRTVTERGGVVLITADHGNAEELINNETGEVDTEHSTYPVPFIICGKQFENDARVLSHGILGDVAPTMLQILNISRPAEMTGRSLL